MLSRLSPERTMVSRKPSWRAVNSVRCRARAMPSTPLSGVRSSWLITARNADLASLAAVASRWASSSAAAERMLALALAPT